MTNEAHQKNKHKQLNFSGPEFIFAKYLKKAN